MPKDNEVDEKVVARFRATGDYAYPVDVAEDGEYVLYDDYAATVAELRAEVERLRTDAYKFRRLARLLDGFDFRLGRNVLMPPATYLDSVEITCEFQPGVGQSVIDAIMDTLTGADPT